MVHELIAQEIDQGTYTHNQINCLQSQSIVLFLCLTFSLKFVVFLLPFIRRVPLPDFFDLSLFLCTAFVSILPKSPALQLNHPRQSGLLSLSSWSIVAFVPSPVAESNSIRHQLRQPCIIALVVRADGSAPWLTG